MSGSGTLRSSIGLARFSIRKMYRYIFMHIHQGKHTKCNEKNISRYCYSSVFVFFLINQSHKNDLSKYDILPT